MNKNINISIVIPAFNEEFNIAKAVERLQKTLAEIKNSERNFTCEIIVVNDASTDKTAEILNGFKDIKVITHHYNKGYGASLKTGARNARNEFLLFYDADGQHDPEYIKEFIKFIPDFDMVVGSRTGWKGPAIRQPGKKILTWVANYLVNKKIPDINCGFRLVKKDWYLKFIYLLPNSFSASTTITLAFYKDAYNIKYIPITINKRERGRSTVKAKHGLSAILLILRMIMLFNPLKVFIPISLFLLLGAVLITLYFLLTSKSLHISSGVVFLSSIMVFSLGLIADQIAVLRKKDE